MKRYPAYKDSGVEWLGEVPEGWEVLPMKAIATCNDETLAEDTDPESEIEYLEISGVDANAGIVETIQTKFKAAPSRARRIVREGDVLVSTVRTYLRAIAQATMPPSNLIASTGFAVLRPRDVKSSYLGYVCRSEYFISEVISRSVGVSYPAINASQIIGLPIPFPSLPEQRAIADFLDREVAKIDGLVAEQRRLIALLAEKRQAVISHAVTRGLNPNAPLKPSGVDWLGDIPEGWLALNLRNCSETIQTGATPSEVSQVDDLAEGFLWYTPGDFGNSIDIARSARAIPSERLLSDNIRVFPAGSVLIVSIGATLGKVAVCSNPCSANQQINAVVPNYRVRPRFLGYSLYEKTDVMRYLSNASTIGIMNQEKTKEIVIAVPTLSEQEEITNFLDESCEKFDALTEAATSAITLLQERRAALISAAVTGKIDVREAPVAPSQILHVSAMVAGNVIAGHWHQAHFGRVKLQKLLYLAQTHAGISEIGGEFLREAAGPLDRNLREQVENELTAVGAIHVEQDQGPGTTVRYKFLGDAATLRSDLSTAIGARMEGFQQLIDRLGDLDTRGIEAVATLYAAWNDLLIDGHTPSEADIIREVRENWHPQKPEKFTASDLGNWMGWMHRHDILPTGKGRKTHTGRLFV